MNIIERGRAFVQGLWALAERTAWDWRRCPHCGDTLTCKWGGYTRQPWTLTGREQDGYSGTAVSAVDGRTASSRRG
jgi:hypothetical protein